MIKNEKKVCSVCFSEELDKVVDLPLFPFTGIYLKNPKSERFKGVDQGLMLCTSCGHAQLQNILEPSLVYDDTYTHRSSSSPIATTGNNYFFDFFIKVTNGKKFKRILEIGCNDLYLIKKMRPYGEKLFGLDPIWINKNLEPIEKVHVLGKFIEELDFDKDLGGPPDLIISAHTFEHIEHPRQQLENLIVNGAEDALFIIEVPGFDSLLKNCRFDQVFHQHIQYFSLASFIKMISEIGGEYIAHDFNYSYWGGTMLVAFKKKNKKHISELSEELKIVPSTKLVQNRYFLFRDQINLMNKFITFLLELGEKFYGYGAAQMLPTIAYHMGADLAFLDAVLDDNSDRDSLMYPNLSIKIQTPHQNLDLKNHNVIIFALDSVRQILKRIMPLNPRRIILPIQIM